MFWVKKAYAEGMRAILLLLLAGAHLAAQIVPGYKAQPSGGYVGKANAADVQKAGTVVMRPTGRRPRLPLVVGSQQNETIRYVEKPSEEAKNPNFPPSLVINPVWEKEKISPKLIEIP